MNRNSPAVTEEWNITSWNPKDAFQSTEKLFVPMHQNIRGVCSTGSTVPYLYGIRHTETVARLCVQNALYLFCLFK